MSGVDDVERIRAASESDARLFQRSEVLMRAFAVAAVITVPVAIWSLVTGNHAVPVGQVIFIAVVAPVGFVVSAWLRRRIARKHGLLAILLLAFFTAPAPAGIAWGANYPASAGSERAAIFSGTAKSLY